MAKGLRRLILRRKPPRYFNFRVYLVGALLYVFLLAPTSLILLIKHGPKWISDSGSVIQFTSGGDTLRTSNNVDTLGDKTPSVSLSLNQLDEQELQLKNSDDEINSKVFSRTSSMIFRILLFIIIVGGIINLPFKFYYRRKRRNRVISDRLYKYCRKTLLYTPYINAGVVLLGLLILHIYMAQKLVNDPGLAASIIEKKLYSQLFYISLVSSLLIILFIYYWQKHRVHILYLEHIFDKEELRKRIFSLRVGKIKHRLWMTSAMTTFLPITIIIFYMLLSLTTIKSLQLDSIDLPELNILFGKYQEMFEINANMDTIDGFFYINAIDSLLMFTGIGTGILISMIYILLFVKWTTAYITKPVAELLKSMKETGRGESGQFAIVRTNDEIGELSEGYNFMSQQIRDYIDNIQAMTDSYYRFVPKQFIDFLGKTTYTDIKLGDQTEREMTVMFSDIRSFTTISEKLTPKENFNLINTYLGLMEPIISRNGGFIDKYIGDAIMALFSENVSNAIRGAIEMRHNLHQVNKILHIDDDIDFGVGIHTGMMMLGIVGGKGRMDGTVISDAVNLASRLEGLTKLYGCSIIISESVVEKLPAGHAFKLRLLDETIVKGKNKAVKIYEVIDGEPETLRVMKIKYLDDYNKALRYFHQDRVEEARIIFERILDENPGDKACQIYTQRCILETGHA